MTGNTMNYYHTYVYIYMCAVALFVSEISTSNYIPTSEELQLLQEMEKLTATTVIEQEGLKYIAGYVAFRFKNKYSFLGTSTEMLVDREEDWINYISRGRLTSPSSDLLHVAGTMNEQFESFHGTSLSSEPWIFRKVADRTEEKSKIRIPREVLLCLVRTRTYISVRNLNKKISAENLKIRHNRKVAKFTNRKVT